MKRWTGPIYAFFEPVPDIEWVEKSGKTRLAHTFTCYNKGCTKKIRRYLDTSDRSSTSNLTRHATSCWGEDAIAAAHDHGTAKAARATVTTPLKRSEDIKLAFDRKGKGKITYSTRQHTRTETRCVCMTALARTWDIDIEQGRAGAMDGGELPSFCDCGRRRLQALDEDGPAGLLHPLPVNSLA